MSNFCCLDLISHLQEHALQYLVWKILHLGFTSGTCEWPIRAVSEMCD